MKSLKDHALALIAIGIIICGLAYLEAVNMANTQEFVHMTIAGAKMSAAEANVPTNILHNLMRPAVVAMLRTKQLGIYNGLAMLSGVITMGLGVFSLVINRKK